MQKITPFLWLDTNAEEAMDFYTSIFKNSKIISDSFGVSWQIVPTVLGELLNDPDPAKSQRVMQAMLQMQKIDIQTLRQAYEQS